VSQQIIRDTVLSFLCLHILITERGFFEETVKIVVGKGDKKKEITNVSKQRLCEVSEFFSRACSDRWKSGREGVIELEQADPKIFSIFLAWAFDRNIENSEDYIIVKDKDEDIKSWEDSSTDRHCQLVDCYILGQELLAADFKNAVMDLIIKNHKFHTKQFCSISATSWQDICDDYGNTPSGSPLRRSLLDTVIAIGKSGFHDNDFLDPHYQPSKVYEEYLIELFNRARPSVNGRHRAPWERDRCDYHDHPGKPSSYSCTKE
jgi:hypothetical protein